MKSACPKRGRELQVPDCAHLHAHNIAATTRRALGRQHRIVVRGHHILLRVLALHVTEQGETGQWVTGGSRQPVTNVGTSLMQTIPAVAPCKP